jgi:hypothetical protein
MITTPPPKPVNDPRNPATSELSQISMVNSKMFMDMSSIRRFTGAKGRNLLTIARFVNYGIKSQTIGLNTKFAQGAQIADDILPAEHALDLPIFHHRKLINPIAVHLFQSCR